MESPTFDEDGYPTDQTLAAIKKWAWEDPVGLLKFVQRAWRYPEGFRVSDGYYRIATGGWSGNESLMAALEENTVFWSLCWVRSKRGGYYEFEIPRNLR